MINRLIVLPVVILHLLFFSCNLLDDESSYFGIKYEVTGTAEEINLEYRDDEGVKNKKISLLPWLTNWSHSFTIRTSGSFTCSIQASNAKNDNSVITVRIFVDDVLMDQDTVSDPSQSASANTVVSY